VYLSDIPYQKAQLAWGTIGLDKTSDNAALSMLIDGAVTNVKKGIWAHATSTVEYDISAYKDYAYFSTYYGLNTTNGNKGNGVKFYIYTSEDGNNWTLRTTEITLFMLKLILEMLIILDFMQMIMVLTQVIMLYGQMLN